MAQGAKRPHPVRTFATQTEMSNSCASHRPPRRRSLRAAAGRTRRTLAGPPYPALSAVRFRLPPPVSTAPSAPPPLSLPRRPAPSRAARPTRHAVAPGTPTGRFTGGAYSPAPGPTVGERAEVGAAARTVARSACPMDACGVALSSTIGDTPGLKNLRRAHVIADVPAVTVADLGLAGCAWCDAPFPKGRSPLLAHEAACRANPRWSLCLAAQSSAAGGRPGSASPGSTGDADASTRVEAPNLFGLDRAAWERARRGFLTAFPAAAYGWAPFVASSARSLPSPLLALRRAWRLLGADDLAWALWGPDPLLAWLWLLLLPTLLLQHPAPAGAVSDTPLT